MLQADYFETTSWINHQKIIYYQGLKTNLIQSSNTNRNL